MVSETRTELAKKMNKEYFRVLMITCNRTSLLKLEKVLLRLFKFSKVKNWISTSLSKSKRTQMSVLFNDYLSITIDSNYKYSIWYGSVWIVWIGV